MTVMFSFPADFIFSDTIFKIDCSSLLLQRTTVRAPLPLDHDQVRCFMYVVLRVISRMRSMSESLSSNSRVI
ncbi:hypothetical protein AHF37_03237 [Paragonimus kellicotti]|nr:hypothetical protein AHF37_03237 [Paragonimus kellicotti]